MDGTATEVLLPSSPVSAAYRLPMISVVPLPNHGFKFLLGLVRAFPCAPPSPVEPGY